MAKVRIRGGDERRLGLLFKALGQIPENLAPVRAAKMRRLEYHIEELDARLQRHLAEYREGGKTRGQVEWWMKREIRDRYNLAYFEGMEAGGNYRDLDALDKRELLRLRWREYAYLRGFLDDVDAGAGRMKYPTRMRMYSDALSGVYWLGWVRANRSNRRRITWRNTPAEHCHDCLELDGKTWTPRAFLRWYRQTHKLPGRGVSCLSNCKCVLEDSFV